MKDLYIILESLNFNYILQTIYFITQTCKHLSPLLQFRDMQIPYHRLKGFGWSDFCLLLILTIIINLYSLCPSSCCSFLFLDHAKLFPTKCLCIFCSLCLKCSAPQPTTTSHTHTHFPWLVLSHVLV